jgi:ubiquinol-cytochrome c reductase cytochrome c1 subunit
MKTLMIPFVAGIALLASSPSFAAGGSGVSLESPRIDQSNVKSLQRGARVFVNYCMGCHTAGYHRYSRLARDLGLSEADVEENFIFTTDKDGAPTKVGSLMMNTMTEDYAKQAFGVVPPNLALTARSRGVDWIYSYMKSFYADPERPIGVNNTVYPGAAMPHVLWDLQGEQRPVYKEVDGKQVLDGFEQVTPGKLSPPEYDKLMADLTNFMAYLADPIKETRHRVGLYVILFLLVLLALSVMLKREYWKDVVK